ncbi:TonB-dependent receptor plug domain-containing protein [Zhouia spongiae]|uniref:TonB-dependent receptor plug domain-containing protein n=1 Tax=Zhouia spongiae TaxID=2202721 RepID=A0ABY3YK44_9FLAO|nr:TonB-dependent receptor plug domain-containing protein [Zhouia spongiae]UNY98197.1 TonB-dependent receptor plug domain-containing protein [Zhouia spongiae]
MSIISKVLKERTPYASYKGTLYIVFLALTFLTIQVKAQESHDNDTLAPIVNLNEVILISSKLKKNNLNYQKQTKPLSSLGEYLESSRKVNMVKRGAYAWEPMLNGMSSERLAVTIDGMRIFGACTDKMDPVTSYVDVSNLSEAHIASGQQGAEYGNTIGGGINLALDKEGFKNQGWTGSLDSGYESNNSLYVLGAETSYSGNHFYLNSDLVYRKADNYKAGGNEEVLFSQYEKYNLSLNSGYKLNDRQDLSATFIYDEARDIGYPALPMDVSLARAFIGSVAFNQDTLFSLFSDWETKAYFNTIKHVMDDTKRPDVPIHMDMPGWSDTYGFYTSLKLNKDRHDFKFKIDGYYNKSFAEMTMYPNNPNEDLMYMLTWPDVRTFNSGIYAEDKMNLEWGHLLLSTRLDIQRSNIKNEFGLNSLKIFYPDMEDSRTRVLKSFSAQFHKQLGNFHLYTGGSFGDRAPSVSEGFGFYLYNSFDNFDYVGNPGLKNEKSLEFNAKIGFIKGAVKTHLEVNHFIINDYIIGVPDASLSPMTIGADGIKIYTNLERAKITNLTFDASCDLNRYFKWSGLISYHRGFDQDREDLPLISPLQYRSRLVFNRRRFSGSISINGAARQNHYSPQYGEDRTDSYTVFSAAVGKQFYIANDDFYVKAGIENIFDSNYSTYTDWKNLPRMGRNFFITLSYTIK